MEHAFEEAKEPLLPSRKSSLNARPVAEQEYSRRKTSGSFDNIATCNWKFDAVTLSPIQASRTFTFLPISAILRAHLPLAWLDSRSLQIPQSGSCLKADISGVPRWEYHVLIARLASGQALYAFERVDTATYICHSLQPWVKAHWVQQAAIGAAPPVELNLLLRNHTENAHSRQLSVASLVGSTQPSAIPLSPKIAKHRKGQLARMSILEAREKTDEPSTLLNEVDVESPLQIDFPLSNAAMSATSEETDAVAKNHTDPRTTVVEQTPQMVETPASEVDELSYNTTAAETTKPTDHLSTEHLRRQYLETLYLSKTSLAFFAKGPLSRARARARVPEASRDCRSLADFYLESILPSKKIDLKYKESIQKKIIELKSAEDDVSGLASQRQFKRTRTKLGKDGLWPFEGGYIEKWWKNQDFACGTARSYESLSAETKRKIAQLRMRETEMQILLVLEVLSLEVREIPSQQVASKPAASEIKIESVEKDDTGLLSKVSPTKKKRDLVPELDLLVDRMCIWHSVGFEDLGTDTIESQKSGSSADTLKNRLRDFCKDVIVPFYCTKLPHESRSICTKMGAPEISPQRSKSGPKPDSSRPTPGNAVVPERLNRKRNLHRILTEDEVARHTSPPGLSRSATLPMPSNVKREPSERPASRSGLQKSASFSNREVDLVADARATAVKRRKLDLVVAQKRELDEAIQNLKRPNRSTVAKSIMDDIEGRSVENKLVARKADPVQISATPRRNRTKAVDMDDYDLPTMFATSTSQGDTVIPSSTNKPRGLDHIRPGVPHASAKKRVVLSAIYDTPSKSASQQTRTASLFDDTPVETGTGTERASSSTLIASTPVNPRLRGDLRPDRITFTPMRMSKSLKPVLITPLERCEADIEQAFRDAPEIPERAGKMMDRVMGSKVDASELSLYDSLGWNDDYD